MTFTGHDRLVDALLPAVRDMFPAATMDRRRRIDRAIGADGMVDPEAIQLLGAIIPGGWIDNATYPGITSTSIYTQMADGIVALTAGTWLLKVRAWLRYGVSDGTLADFRLVVDGVPQADTTRSGPSASAGPGFLWGLYPGIEGNSEIPIWVDIKSDTGGSVTCNQVMVDVDAYRTA